MNMYNEGIDREENNLENEYQLFLLVSEELDNHELYQLYSQLERKQVDYILKALSQMVCFIGFTTKLCKMKYDILSRTKHCHIISEELKKMAYDTPYPNTFNGLAFDLLELASTRKMMDDIETEICNKYL